MPPTYEDFTLIIDGPPDRYTIAAQGPAQIRVAPVPFVLHDTDEFRAAIASLKQGATLSSADMTALGTQLFEALFPRPIFRAFERARSAVSAETALRLKLVVRPPALSYLPWEFIYDPDEQVFLAARLSYPLVRSIEVGTPVAHLLARRPLRVLYVQANPSDTQPLNLRAGEQALRDGLGATGEVTALYDATPALLRDTLRQSPGFHILHYDGHAEFDTMDDAGHIALHDADGRTYPLSGELLATYLDGTSIRLVVLAACETAVDSQQKRFAGIAHTLMRASSLPAVVANQFAILDESAIAFNRGFYGALADDYPVDAATIEGRKAILELFGGSADAAFSAPDWATPVLFMRTADGAIFNPELTREDIMSDNKRNSGSNINTDGGVYVGGGINTGGGDFVGRDKNVQGDAVQGDKIDARGSQGLITNASGPINQNFGTQRNINTDGGDYSEGNIDKRSGAFVSGGTVYGPVVGSSSGTITTSYGGFPGGSSQPTPLQQALQSVQQAQQGARHRGNSDLADDLDVVIGALVSALKAQDAGNTERRASKIRDAQMTLRHLATSDTSLATTAQQLDRLT